MKIKVPTIQKGSIKRESLPLVTEPHNIRYSHAEKNCLYFQVLHFPYKELTKVVAEHESGNVRFMKSFIRAVIKRQETCLQFIFRFQVEKPERRKSGELRRRSLVEKEKVFLIEAEKCEVVQFVEPLLIEIENVNRKQDAALFISSFKEWAHPLTLESVIEGLTDDQKLLAAKMLQAYFVA